LNVKEDIQSSEFFAFAFFFFEVSSDTSFPISQSLSLDKMQVTIQLVGLHVVNVSAMSVLWREQGVLLIPQSIHLSFSEWDDASSTLSTEL